MLGLYPEKSSEEMNVTISGKSVNISYVGLSQ
jgi:hypothetical protein